MGGLERPSEAGDRRGLGELDGHAGADLVPERREEENFDPHERILAADGRGPIQSGG